MYNGKLYEDCLSTAVCLYENPKSEALMLLKLNPDSIVQELKRIKFG